MLILGLQFSLFHCKTECFFLLLFFLSYDAWKISREDYVNNRNHIAKMRSLLFRHEVKMKRVKKIKSKTYHRLLKKDRLKGSVGMPMDAEEAKELAMKQEFKRAEVIDHFLHI
jgi:U3 small nucleolar RNA-associated protein 14